VSGGSLAGASWTGASSGVCGGNSSGPEPRRPARLVAGRRPPDRPRRPPSRPGCTTVEPPSYDTRPQPGASWAPRATAGASPPPGGRRCCGRS
jgi:hypothetical protein